MHIPKCAGTSITHAFSKLYKSEEICPARDEPSYETIDANDYKYFTGHIGFELSNSLNANIVTILRNPIDRFISVYNFWNQLHEQGKSKYGIKTAWALDIEEFVEYFNEIELIAEFFNRMTWQVAHSHHLFRRRELLGISQEDLLALAKQNLRKCAVVGFLDDIPKFTHDCRDILGVDLDIKEKNLTQEKYKNNPISADVRKKIEKWVRLDLNLYEHFKSQ